MMAGGYVKLWRVMLDHEIMSDDWICRIAVWCLLRANYMSANFKGQLLSPGQFVTGRITGANELNVSPSKWYRGIDRLSELGFIEKTTNSNWTTITICNWQTYQDYEDSNEQQADSKRTAGDTTNGQPADTNEEGKKGRREEKDIPPTPKSEKTKSKPRTATPVSIPGQLNTPEFLVAWSEWEQHKREIKNALTPLAARKALIQLANLGVDKAIIAIERSIAAGWKGIYHDSKNSPGAPQQPEPRRYPTDEECERHNPSAGATNRKEY